MPVQADAGDPTSEETCVLPGCQTALRPIPASEEIFGRLLACVPHIVVDGLSGSFGQLELDRSACLLLPHGRSINRVTTGRDVVDPERHDITAAELAVDCEIEQGKIADPAINVELGPNGLYVFWSQRRLCPCQLAFVPRHALWGRRSNDHFILHGHPPRLQTPRRMEPAVKALVSGRLSDHFGLGLMRRRKRPVAFDPKLTPLRREYQPRPKSGLLILKTRLAQGRSVPAAVSGCGLSVAIAVLLAFVGNVAAQDRFP